MKNRFLEYVDIKTTGLYSYQFINDMIQAVPENKWFTFEPMDNRDSFWQQMCRIHACMYRVTPIHDGGLQKIKYSYYFNKQMDYKAVYDSDELIYIDSKESK